MIENKILDAFKRFALLGGGKSVIVALSGGADSMALLFALNALKDKLGITLKAAHLNHQIRGQEAVRDEEFVKAQCKKLGIELVTESVDVPTVAKALSISTELAARRERYAFFERISKNAVIATAHSASDNLETVLFNLTRGSAIDGLCGIPPKRDKYIRPLILCTRSEVEDYCKANNIDYVVDSTNLCDDYTRNKIRHSVVPVLKEINPAVEAVVSNTSFHLREDASLLNDMSQEMLENLLGKDGGLEVSWIQSCEKSLATRVIKAFAEAGIEGADLGAVHIDSMYDNCVLKGTKTSLPKDFCAVVRKGKLYIEKDSSKIEFTEIDVEICKKNDFSFEKPQKVNNLLLNNLLDCDKIVGKLVKRTRQAGDSIRLRGRGCTKTLNKLFSENAVPVGMRDKLPILADDKGVVWVYSFGASERCSVSKTSKNVLEVFEKKENKNE